jgi:hypothetical protein
LEINTFFGINIREKRHNIHKNPTQNTFTKQHVKISMAYYEIWSKTNVKSYYGGKICQT